MRRIWTALGAALISAMLVMGLTACGGGDDRWCEWDATDTRVANSYCEDGVPGYEWEPDADGHKKPKGSKSTSSTGTSSPSTIPASPSLTSPRPATPSSTSPRPADRRNSTGSNSTGSNRSDTTDTDDSGESTKPAKRTSTGKN
ncbi:hypothetical protein GWI34_26725 [Actinomadura sp. DSM 109109]|nr:hypothetical protein [Actinomadura lepetitiana]